MLETLPIENECQYLQLSAAKMALSGEFNQAVDLMKRSVGIPPEENPDWVFLSINADALKNIAGEIGNVFLYNQLRTKEFGGAACAILMGHYGSAVQIMISHIRRDQILKLAEAMPEDLTELQIWLDAHPPVFPANDGYIPSWVV